jgi:hypothetical protein
VCCGSRGRQKRRSAGSTVGCNALRRAFIALLALLVPLFETAWPVACAVHNVIVENGDERAWLPRKRRPHKPCSQSPCTGLRAGFMLRPSPALVTQTARKVIQNLCQTPCSVVTSGLCSGSRATLKVTAKPRKLVPIFDHCVVNSTRVNSTSNRPCSLKERHQQRQQCYKGSAQGVATHSTSSLLAPLTPVEHPRRHRTLASAASSNLFLTNQVSRSSTPCAEARLKFESCW